MSDELFEPPFNLAGEPLTSELNAEGEARVRALAESEARKAQTKFAWIDEPLFPKVLNIQRPALSKLL